MEFERYIRWLRLVLPKQQREDIILELSEEYHSQASEREALVGRPLNRDERDALIAQFGHPLQMAARYRPERCLVGPLLFPFYGPALTSALGLTFGIGMLSALIRIGRDVGSPAVLSGLAATWNDALAVFAWVTVAFAIADRLIARNGALKGWHPAAVPPPLQHARSAVHRVAGTLEHVAPHRRPAPRESVARGAGSVPSLFGFIVSLVFSVWFLLALRFPGLIFGNGATVLEWGPSLDRMYPVIAIFQVALLLVHFLHLTDLGHGRWSQVVRLVAAVNSVVFLYLFVTLDRRWVVWRAGAQPAADLAGDWSLVDTLNDGFSALFVLVAVIGLVGIGRRLWHRLGRGRENAAHA